MAGKWLKSIWLVLGILLCVSVGSIANAQTKKSVKHNAAWYREHDTGSHSAAWYKRHGIKRHSAAWYRKHGGSAHSSSKHSAAWYKEHNKKK